MTINIVIPVYNRLECTKRIVACLRAQTVDEELKILVVDDGSTDGTAEYLSLQHDIEVIQGDSTLWWGGAIDLAIKKITKNALSKDWVLLINNDASVDSDYVQSMLKIAHTNPMSAVGSVVYCEDAKGKVLSLGPKIDPWKFKLSDLVSVDTSHQENCFVDSDTIEVRALSGRGVLFPVNGLIEIKGMRPKLLPHYLADYELSVRLNAAGWRLLVSRACRIYSKNDFGSALTDCKKHSFFHKLFAIKSPLYLPAQLIFWWQVSTKMQKITMPFRMAFYLLFPGLRKN